MAAYIVSHDHYDESIRWCVPNALNKDDAFRQFLAWWVLDDEGVSREWMDAEGEVMESGTYCLRWKYAPNSPKQEMLIDIEQLDTSQISQL